MALRSPFPLIGLGLLLLAAPSGAADDPPGLTLADAARWHLLADAAAALDPEVIAAEAEVRAAEALVAQARATNNPALEVELEEFAPWDDLGTPTARVGYLVEREGRGKIAGRVAVAEAEVARARAEAAALRNEAAGEVLELLVEVAPIETAIAALRQSQGLLETTVQVISLRVEEGEAPGSELRRLQAESSAALAELLQLEAELQGAWIPIASRTGRSPEDAQEHFGDFTLAVPRWELAQWQEAALAHHPTLALYAAEIGIVERELAAARAESRSDLTYSAFVERSEEATSVGVGLEIPLKQGGNGTAALQEALTIRTTAAQDARHMAQQRIQLEVAQRWAALQATQAPIDTLANEALPAAARARDAAHLAYTEGEGTLLDYLDAVRQHQELVAQLVEARAAHQRALVALVIAAGLAAHPEVLQ
ncbi:MAG TPA: TolC family protein [bacterium]|nr:TolC family protein [bacterium]